MIFEFLRYLTTPSPWRWRQWGYLTEWIGIRSRYERCRSAWNPHYFKCQDWVERVLLDHPEIKRVIFCGSGWGEDIPWNRDCFKSLQKIYLVDLFHSHTFRAQSLQDPRLELVKMDLSGVIDQLDRRLIQKTKTLPNPIYDFSLRADLVVSLNVATQFSIPLLNRIEKWRSPIPDAEQKQWASSLQSHYLQKMQQWAPRHLLIADLEEQWVDPHGEILESFDPWYGARDWSPEEEWMWEVAPLGEIASTKSKRHRVGVIRLGLDPHRAP